MIHTIKKIKNFFMPLRLSQECFDAYYDRLPDTIQVSWKKDGDMIVGDVVAGEKSFFTQGEDVDDFIEMVNDSIYTVYEIPFDYIDAISRVKAFKPTKEEFNRLYDVHIREANILMRKKEHLQLAQ